MKIHAILTETLACFFRCRAKDLSAPPLYRWIFTAKFWSVGHMKGLKIFLALFFVVTANYGPLSRFKARLQNCEK